MSWQNIYQLPTQSPLTRKSELIPDYRQSNKESKDWKTLSRTLTVNRLYMDTLVSLPSVK